MNPNVFFVKFCYEKLLYVLVGLEMDLLGKLALEILCEAKVLSKVNIFGWRLAHGRLPTMKHLQKEEFCIVLKIDCVYSVRTRKKMYIMCLFLGPE